MNEILINKKTKPMKTKKIINAPSLLSVLLNPYYKGRINEAKELQIQADYFANLARFARGELAYAISKKLVKLVPEGPGKILLKMKQVSFVPRKSSTHINLTRGTQNLICELVNSSLNRSNCMDRGKVFWGNGCALITEYGIDNYLKTADPEAFLKSAINIINEAWAKDNNNLGSLAFDELVDDKKAGQRYRVIFKPGLGEVKPISGFYPGMAVSASCHHEGCENVKIPIILGKEEYFHPHFSGPGGIFKWEEGTVVKHFAAINPDYERISPYCPKCSVIYSTVFVVGKYLAENEGLPIIFLYEPEGC